MTNQEKVDALLEHMKTHKNKWFSMSVLSKLFNLDRKTILRVFGHTKEIKKDLSETVRYSYVDFKNEISPGRLEIREYKPSAAMIRAMDRVGEVYPPEHKFIGIHDTQ